MIPRRRRNRTKSTDLNAAAMASIHASSPDGGGGASTSATTSPSTPTTPAATSNTAGLPSTPLSTAGTPSSPSKKSSKAVEEEKRRRNEISAFAAMALGGDYGSSPGGHEPEMVTTKKKSSPASLSAAAAAVLNDNNDSDDNDGGLLMAVQPLTSSPARSTSTSSIRTGTSSKKSGSKGYSNEPQQPWPQDAFSQAIAQANAAADAETTFGSTTTAAMAAAASSSAATPTTNNTTNNTNNNNNTPTSSSGTFAFDKSKHETSSAERCNLEAALAALEKDPYQKSSSAAGGGTRTFNFSSANNGVGGATNSVLLPTSLHQNKAQGNNATAAATAAQKRLHEAPMYAEQVVLSRPLFFGPILPPRVIRQARAMVVAAYQDLGYYDDDDLEVVDATTAERGNENAKSNEENHNDNSEIRPPPSSSSSHRRHRHRRRPKSPHEQQQPPQDNTSNHQHRKASMTTTTSSSKTTKEPPPLPRLADLPDSVRNLVGAIRTFGHGIDVLEQDPEQVDPKYFWKGSPHVVTYAPVWGEAQRAEDIKQFRKKYHRPPVVVRSSTAPARMSATGAQSLLSLENVNHADKNDGNTCFASAMSTISTTKDATMIQRVDSTDSAHSSPLPVTDTGQSTAEQQQQQEQALTSTSAWLSAATGGSFDSTGTSPHSNTNNNNSSQIERRASENQQFSAWIRSDDDSAASGGNAANPFRQSSLAEGGANSIGSARSIDSFTMTPSNKDTDAPSSPPTILSNNSSDGRSTPSPQQQQQQQAAAATVSEDGDATLAEENKATSEQILFSQWARGVPAGAGGSIMMDSTSSKTPSKGPQQSTFVDISAMNNSSTFQKTPIANNLVDSDDDSVIDDELKKQVGLSDHLSKALASLANDGTTGGEPPDITLDNDDSQQALLSQVPPGDGSAGRPLTNYELTNGCVPLFGTDDPPLPVESDLGIHETKEEQQRAYDQKKSQEIVEKFVGPNVFGSIACPNPALNPDDFHSWNARVSGSPQRLMGMAGGGGVGGGPAGGGTNGAGMSGAATGGGTAAAAGGTAGDSISLPSLQSRRPGQSTTQDNQTDAGNTRATTGTATTAAAAAKQKDAKRFATPRLRYGWWNVGKQSDWPATVSKPKEKDAPGVSVTSAASSSAVAAAETGGADGGNNRGSDVAEAGQELQLPPLHHSSSVLQVVTALEPTPGQLRKDNKPLSHMHAATTMAQTLPYISDRPPSYRYLQVDTQGVGFPPVGGEVEPLFCSLAIYNVETVSSSGANNEQSSAPVPDLQRCGRVTEVLNFDVVRDSEIAKRCSGALWPHNAKSPYSQMLRGQANPAENEEQLEGTRCGVFPLPSNLNFANLYAVLLVQKVLSEDSLDLYLKPNYNASDLSKLRSNAERASKRYGAFLVPFSFGVAPLLQVFGGAENPAVTSSRAVQIPLFRFSPGLGERQIIEHIMVMLNPKADHRAAGVGGPVARTNGGTAMLVMRNFGFLGLHQVVDNVSSLARDRLVDFTGELQLRRSQEGEKDNEEKKDDNGSPTKIDFQRVLPDWGEPEFVAEPTRHGGRNNSQESGPARLSKYAQELAPVPLQLSPSVRLTPPVQPGMPRSRLHGHDIEPFYHTTFCNEMLVHPRLIHNCPKGNIVIKVELREIEWNQNLMAYFAHLPSSGPAMHCNRRGPFLVQSAFTSCVPRGSEKHFIDEFKLKLPLDLKPRGKDGLGRALSMFFTVYNIKMSCKKKWKRKLFGGGSSVESFGGFDELDPGSRMEQVACGFLPITTSACLIDNGLHDVRILYAAHRPTKNLCEQEMIDDTTLVLVEKTFTGDGSTTGRESSYAEDTTMSNDDTGSLAATDPGKADNSIASASEITSIAEDSLSKSDRGKTLTEPISLSVRLVVHSSLHCQNEMLSEFLDQEPDLPQTCPSVDNVFLSKLRMGRDFLLSNAVLSAARMTPSAEDKLYESTIEIVKYQVCPVARTHGHFLRTMSVLWRSLLSGSGKPDLAWSNPAATLPLRLHAFASILQLLGSVSLFLTKNGVTLVDGKSKWNVVKLGRVVALFFDEQKLFGEHATEAFDQEYWAAAEARSVDRAALPTQRENKHSPIGRRARHVRQNYDIFNDLQNRETEPSVDSPEKDDAAVNETIPKPKSPDQPADAGRKSPERPSTNSEGDQTAAAPAPQRKLKLDSKTDFQSALRAASAAADDFDRPETDGSKTAKAMIQAFGSGGSSVNRKWAMTLPTRALSTIREGDDGDMDELGIDGLKSESIPLMDRISSSSDKTDSLDDELVINHPKKPKPRQMRIPNLRKKACTIDFSADLSTSLPEIAVPKQSPANTEFDFSGGSLPRSDEEIETAGTAFIDVIGKSLGLGLSSGNRGLATEEQRVGSSHHRKARSRSSIDWTLLGDGSLTAFSSGALESSPLDATEEPLKQDSSNDQNETLSTLKTEVSTAIRLPDFADRLIAAGKNSSNKARWFPFAYEVIILQWSSILIQQRAAGEKSRPERSSQSNAANSNHPPSTPSPVDESVAAAAARSIGVAVAGAPMLFEVIKQSLGFRITSLFRNVLVTTGNTRACPPLVTLDETLLLGLEQVVSMVADACIDSRNFDSWDLRQMSIDVNDSIVRFLRDMWSFLAPSCVYRLILAYLSRFVTKDGKHWQDRDSSIGLRCSWEITKLRLNAITALIRFPDFLRVNGPQMLNWTEWWAPAPTRSDFFFNDVLNQYQRYRLPDFVGSEGANQRSKINIPPIHPHWLAEIAVDVCLLGTEHAEPQIQQRSAALLHEFFWASSQEGILSGLCAPVASMYISFIEKILTHVNYLSNFSHKSQLRKDILPCVVFVLQSAPTGLVRAFWRRLCGGLPGQAINERYGGSLPAKNGDKDVDPLLRLPKGPSEVKEDPNILDMFGLLNLSLRTMEYEGAEEHLEGDISGAGASRDSIDLWRKEYLLSKPQKRASDARSRRNRKREPEVDPAAAYTSSISRKWHGHDGSLVIINAGHQIVWEIYNILNEWEEGGSFLNPAVQNSRAPKKPMPTGNLSRFSNLTHADIVVLVRAASSLYLHSLALKQSDIVIIRTFKVSAELIKIFGIKAFLEAIGETLQHWMRVISLQCGARRANVRIEATDLLELILRSTWECYGSFFRIRVPLLAVQTEVMERIVATAAARYYRDQRRLRVVSESFSNVSAEASLVPLWRTLDRIEKQPASQNIAFRGALIRMSGKLKKLYRAYIAARVLSFIQGARANEETVEGGPRDHDKEALVRANRISILRVINVSQGHSKQFLGFHATTQQRSRVAHFEAVEDALIDAADVFSPTELPEHRVAWLRMLADFHSSRNRFAEEGTCHFHIHVTLQQAARLHGSLWSNTPFLPWTDNIPDPVYIDGDSPTTDPDFEAEYGFDDGGQYGSSPNSFRRIFYRVANSVAIPQDDWDTGVGQNLFCGIATPHEYHTVSPWVTLRDMEDQMVEEAEAAGELFLSAGIIESSRFAWSLATQYYAQKFNYSKLALAYGNLARTVVSRVPPIDASLPQEVSAVLGRFYRVWFHGGAPDELSGVEFVYRTEGSVRLDQFGQELKEVIKSIIPDKTPIHLVLDGRVDERLEDNPGHYGFNRLGPTPLEPVRIKVTPLRPLFGMDNNMRGLPEWFYRYADEAFAGLHHRSKNELDRPTPRGNGSPSHTGDVADPHHHGERTKSFSASVFSSTGSSAGGAAAARPLAAYDTRASRFTALSDGELSGVDKFCFLQPKDRSKGSKEWWRNTTGDYAEKTLKVTQLQVAQSFPACVARQAVVHRLVYSQSPLEAGVDAVCQWNAVLFRTAVATIGMAVLGSNSDPGIGTDAVKVVADCIHSSHIKEIGLGLMKKNSDSAEGQSNGGDLVLDRYDRLTDDEVRKLQVKLARLIVVFIELLHLLIARNRQILLDVIQERKKNDQASVGSSRGGRGRSSSVGPASSTLPESVDRRNRERGDREKLTHAQRSNSIGSTEFSAPTPAAARDQPHQRTVQVEIQGIRSHHQRSNTYGGRSEDSRGHRNPSAFHRAHSEADQQSFHSTTSAGGGVRAESAIAVQSELQRSFINMVKTLYPRIQGVMQADTPRWLKQCAQDSYFSLGTYKQTKIPIAEELCFTSDYLTENTGLLGQQSDHFERGLDSGSIGGGSNHSIVSRGSERYGYGHF